MSVLALSYLQYTIINNKTEINRLYDEFVVSGRIVAAQPSSPAFDIGNIVGQRIVDNLSESAFVSQLYLETGVMNVGLVPYGEADFQRLADKRDDFTDWLLAFNDLDYFIYDNMPREFDGAVGIPIISDYIGDFSLTFGFGFSETDFGFYDGQQFVPIILHESLLNRYGLEFGDFAHLATSRLSVLDVRIIGSFTGGSAVSAGRFQRPMMLAPINSLPLTIMTRTYNTVRFYVDTAYNRELLIFRDEMRRLLASFDELTLILGDDELRLVIGPLEQNLLLLELLYPVALTVVTILAAGLAVLIVLQSAKIAAIMRSLGAKGRYVRLILNGEYLIVSVLGIILAVVFMLLFNISFLMVFVPAGLYLTGALAGAVTGSVLNTNRSVLELLQVRE